MRDASSAFARRSSGFASPRSAKMLSLPICTLIFSAMSASSFLLLRPLSVIFLRPFEARLHQVDLGFRRLDPALRFLLKDVQNIYEACQPDCINGSVCIAVIIFDYFQHAGTAE